MRSTILAAALTAAVALPALAEGLPTLDVASTCRSSGSASPDAQAAGNGCLRSEREAQDVLKRRWSEFGASAQRQCANQHQAGGFPSYVELLTCLELASGSVAVRPSAADPAATGSPRAPEKPVRAQSDADPNQRIDPKAVLGKPTGSGD